MRVYMRTSRNTGVSLPWWLAIPFALGWLIWATLVLCCYCSLALAVKGVRAARDHRAG